MRFWKKENPDGHNDVGTGLVPVQLGDSHPDKSGFRKAQQGLSLQLIMDNHKGCPYNFNK
jgi:hypothetical protein